MFRGRADYPQPNVPNWNLPIGGSFLYTAANWGAVSFFLEVFIRSTSAKATAALYDVTAGAQVAGSTVTKDAASDPSGNYTRLRSGAVALVDGHEYRVQFGSQDGGAGGALKATLIAV
jgi:hypothetical protein